MIKRPHCFLIRSCHVSKRCEPWTLTNIICPAPSGGKEASKALNTEDDDDDDLNASFETTDFNHPLDRIGN